MKPIKIKTFHVMRKFSFFLLTSRSEDVLLREIQLGKLGDADIHLTLDSNSIYRFRTDEFS